MHTILGMTIDSAIGECFDKAMSMLNKYKKVLDDQAQIREFINKYNNKSKEEKIPEDYFKFLKDTKISRGRIIEMMAKYGDPSENEYPLGFRDSQNADMTFTGLKTSIKGSVTIK